MDKTVEEMIYQSCDDVYISSSSGAKGTVKRCYGELDSDCWCGGGGL